MSGVTAARITGAGTTAARVAEVYHDGGPGGGTWREWIIHDIGDIGGFATHHEAIAHADRLLGRARVGSCPPGAPWLHGDDAPLGVVLIVLVVLPPRGPI